MLQGIRVEGAAELRAALKQAADQGLAKQVATANKDAAQIVVESALPHVPRRTGALAHSVRALGSQRAGRVRAGTAAVQYAAAIHWGRKRGNVGSPPGNHPGRNRIIGRPFLTDALRREQVHVANEYARAIDQLTEEIARRAQ